METSQSFHLKWTQDYKSLNPICYTLKRTKNINVALFAICLIEGATL